MKSSFNFSVWHRTMGPNTTHQVSFVQEGQKDRKIVQDEPYKPIILWKRVTFFVILNSAALFVAYKILTNWDYFTAFIISWFINDTVAMVGVTMGAHRLFAHKSFKARLPVKIFLLLAHASTGQNSMYVWVRDHRVHHKFSDTDADPHNSNRGFFFSHMGWLMMNKHPDVKRKGQTVDMSDLSSDYWVMLQYKYIIHLFVILNILLTYPYRLMGYSWEITFLVGFLFRYVRDLHFTWLVNSVAHFYGDKPYNREIKPVETKIVSYLTGGEGWHNYHHTFPWDYKAGEYGNRLNLTCQIIELCAKLGLVYDLKSPSPDMVDYILLEKGDGSHITLNDNINNNNFTKPKI